MADVEGHWEHKELLVTVGSLHGIGVIFGIDTRGVSLVRPLLLSR